MAERKAPASGDARLGFIEPVKKQELTFSVLPVSRLEVIKHQRKPSDSQVKRLVTSIERIGFVAPLVVVAWNGGYLIIDGQHRFLAAKELGARSLPAVIVPKEMARRMLNLNVEKEPNIRERSSVALSIYRELVEQEPKLNEDEAHVADAVEHAHYVTLGLGYEQDGRLAGSSFEPILKKCDGFIDAPVAECLPVREERAAKVVEANKRVRTIAAALKERGMWHQFVGAQIISYANPLKRARKPASFDSTFDRILSLLEELQEHPERVLRESAD